MPSDGIWLSPWDMGQISVDSRIKLERGDVMILYTNGVTEPRDVIGEMFSGLRLAGILKKSGNLKTEGIKNKIIDALDEYKIDDDLTIVLLKKK